ncbi:MAG: four helix bundle protein [Bacteroidales bacterium]|nr:four helix bundle protein [Bacteroidales bacterium]
MHNFKELIVWQKARKLVKKVYLVVKNFPEEEKYGMISQIKRASISIPANIAEGAGRRTNNDFGRFLDIATGSSFELETLIILSLDLDFIEESDYNNLIEDIEEIQKMIYSLKARVQSNS